MSVTLYHNPHCSKSRETLKLLRERGVEPAVVEYLKTPPSKDELARLLDLLGLEPRELIRTSEAEYKANGLDQPGLDRDTLIAAMVTHPRLIQRPIAVNGDRVAIGRPPERVLDVL